MIWKTYEDFKEEVLGQAIDFDGKFSVQCVDLLNYFWFRQVGRYILTGNGYASGIWNELRFYNAGNEFELVQNLNDLKVGDIVILNIPPYGHCGFVNKVLPNGTIEIMDENHTGRNEPTKIYVMDLRNKFLGAFRLKFWKEETIPTNPIIDEGFKIGDKVVPTALYDYNGTKVKQWDDEYIITQIIGNRAVLSARGQVWCAMNTKNLRKV